jgi:hypothetical protein
MLAIEQVLLVVSSTITTLVRLSVLVAVVVMAVCAVSKEKHALFGALHHRSPPVRIIFHSKWYPRCKYSYVIPFQVILVRVIKDLVVGKFGPGCGTPNMML